MNFLEQIPFAHSTHTWVCQYGYSAACAGGFALAVRRIALEEQKGEINRKVQIYSLGYAVSCALEVGLEFKIFPNPRIASLVSNGAYFGGAALRLGEEETPLKQSTCVMDMANAVVYVGVGPNPLSTAFTLLSPLLGLWPDKTSNSSYLPV